MKILSLKPAAAARTVVVFAIWAAFRQAGCFAGVATDGAETSPGREQLQQDGLSIINRMVEANRVWLVGPPKSVREFSYELHRSGAVQEFTVTAPEKAPPARLRATTYSAVLPQLARSTKSVRVLSVSQEGKSARLALRFDPPVRCAIGNGVENSWNGYHSFGVEEGTLVIDTDRWVPLETQFGRLNERFAEFVQVDSGQLAPLQIHLEVGDAKYDWRFRVYEPGLWLLDDSFSEGRKLAWVEKVAVNTSPANVAHATSASQALAASVNAGNERALQVLKANQLWLLPSLEARRGLVYEYRQEEPYLERVIFDPEGNALARLESSKESVGQPTRQHLRLADGRSYSGPVSNTLVRLEASPVSDSKKKASLGDGLIQHLAVGLAFDCALTQMARDPDRFWAEVQPANEGPAFYKLVLRPKGDARLFTGTMLAFTSWAYMHDVGYTRSEVLVEAKTHRPVEERDFAAKDELKGQYTFEQWLEDAAGAAPGQIRAVLPHAKDGKDQSLEMEAQFRFAKPGVWLLKQVTSRFRGSAEGSKGTITCLEGSESEYASISQLVQLGEQTEKLMAGLAGAEETVQLPAQGSEWIPVLLKASWSEQARESLKSERRVSKDAAAGPVIGIHRARLNRGTAGNVLLELEGLSTAAWQEFRSRWELALTDDRGRLLGTTVTNSDVRAENGPTPFFIKIALPSTEPIAASEARQVLLKGTIERMTGAYHGHGVWMRFAEK